MVTQLGRNELVNLSYDGETRVGIVTEGITCEDEGLAFRTLEEGNLKSFYFLPKDVTFEPRERKVQSSSWHSFRLEHLLHL